MIELVLGTEMKGHFAIISHFRTVHRLASNTDRGGASPVSRSRSRSSTNSSSASGRGRGPQVCVEQQVCVDFRPAVAALPYPTTLPCCPAALPSCPPRSCTLRPAPIRPPALPPSRSYTLPEDIPEGHVTLASPIMPADGGALVYDFVYDVQQDK